MFNNNIERDLMKACESKCNINRDVLPSVRVRFCAPLVVVVQSMRTTNVIAKCILLMLCPSNTVDKVFRMFDYDLYRPVAYETI